MPARRHRGGVIVVGCRNAAHFVPRLTQSERSSQAAAAEQRLALRRVAREACDSVGTTPGSLLLQQSPAIAEIAVGVARELLE